MPATDQLLSARLSRFARRLGRLANDRRAAPSVSPHPAAVVVDPAEIAVALQQRLDAVGPVLLGPSAADVGPAVPVTFGSLVAAVHADPSAERVWLLLCGLTAQYPTSEAVLSARRMLQLCDPVEAALRLLDEALDSTNPQQARRRITLAVNEVIVDVDQSARQLQHTGVKEVVRSTLPLWHATHEPTLAAWADDGSAWRALEAHEAGRVLNWRGAEHHAWPAVDTQPDAPLVLVPYRCVLVLPDIATNVQAAGLYSLAAHTDNRVVVIGYDCIPVVSADLVPWGMAGRFVSYLSVVKQARRVAAISATAAAEFEGFGSALPSQGLRGPQVSVCALPSPPATKQSQSPPATTQSQSPPATRQSQSQSPGDRGAVSVLMVGSFEPRKNHLAVLQAAELLWQEGHVFELVLIGGMTWGSEGPDRVSALQRAGRPIVVHHAAPTQVVEEAYRAARFTVFPSLHEGYGLPVAESMAAGTPVITSNFGSTAEVAAGGGALLIDPRDDLALLSALRRLLTDDDELERLRREIATRPSRSWDDYAGDLWASVVEPELTSLMGLDPALAT